MELKEYDTTERQMRLMNVRDLKVPEGTDKVVSIEDILIPTEYARTKVSMYKIKKVIKYYVKHLHLDKPISVIAEVNEKGFRNKLMLNDEYSRYITALHYLGLKYVPVKYIDVVI